jgi:hypothetical protein
MNKTKKKKKEQFLPCVEEVLEHKSYRALKVFLI